MSSGNIQQQTKRAVPLRGTSGDDGISIIGHHGDSV